MGLSLGVSYPPVLQEESTSCVPKAREILSHIVPAPTSKALESEHNGRNYSCSGFFSQQTIDTELLRVDSCYSRFIFKLVFSRT